LKCWKKKKKRKEKKGKKNKEKEKKSIYNYGCVDLWNFDGLGKNIQKLCGICILTRKNK
jgi:hypothetical protein